MLTRINEVRSELEAGTLKVNDVYSDNKDGYTPLHMAILADDIDLVTKLLEAAADPDAKNNRGETPLMIAIREASTDVVNVLVDRGADLGVKVNEVGNSLLHLACMNKDSKHLRNLLTHRVDVNVVNSNGESPLHIAAQSNSKKRFISALLEAGADPQLLDRFGKTPVDYAANNHPIGKYSLIYLLVAMHNAGADMKAVLNNEGMTATHFAAQLGVPALLQGIIDKDKSAVSVTNKYGNTPLAYAIEERQLECVDLLVKTRAYDLSKITDQDGNTLLHVPEIIGDSERVKYCIESGANPFQLNIEGLTPLDLAIKAGNLPAVMEIIKLMPDINAPFAKRYATGVACSNNDTVLMAAIRERQTEIVVELLDKGANLNQQDRNGETLLHYAIRDHQYDLVSYLINLGADVHIKNARGKTPLQLAFEENYPNITSVFLHGGKSRPETISNIDEYIKYITPGNAGNEINDNDEFDVTAFQGHIADHFYDNYSGVASMLGSMPTSDKANLIAILVMNDTNAIRSFFAENPYINLLTDFGYELNDLKYLAVHDDKVDSVQNNYWFSPAISQMINSLMKVGSDDYITETASVRLFTEAMSRVPDEMITITAKSTMIQTIYSHLKKVRTPYNEYQIPMSSTKESLKVSHADYYRAVTNADPVINISDFILQTVGLLQQYEDRIPDLVDELQEIRFRYLATEYDEALDIIINLVEQHEDILGTRLSDTIIAECDNIGSVDIKNYSRRFFENRLAALQLGMSEKLEPVNRVLAYFDIEPAASMSELVVKISHLAEINNPEALALMDELKAQSGIYKVSKKFAKNGFVSKMEELQDNILGASVFSRNMGVMTSNQPNYYDEISKYSLRNSPADTYKPYDDSTYNRNPRLGAFAAGLSGHAYFVVALLYQYASNRLYDSNIDRMHEINKANEIADPITRENEFETIERRFVEALGQIKEDVNQVLVHFISAYVSRGYHSTLEITDVIAEPHIQQLFNDINIDVKCEYNPDALLKAFTDTQAYSVALLQKQLLNREIEKQSLSGEESNTDETKNISLARNQSTMFSRPSNIIPTPGKLQSNKYLVLKDAKNVLPGEPNIGDEYNHHYQINEEVWAEHRIDGLWYRAIVTDIDANDETKITVEYTDYGLSHTITKDEVCPNYALKLFSNYDEIRSFDTRPTLERLQSAGLDKDKVIDQFGHVSLILNQSSSLKR